MEGVVAEFDPELADLVSELNRSAGKAGGGESRGQARPDPQPSSKDLADLDAVLQYGVDRGASDVILTAGCSLVLRIQGELVKGAEPVYSDPAIRNLISPLLNAAYREELDRDLTLDFGFIRENIGRFRTNVHFQRGTMGVAIRVLPKQVPTLDSLRLPKTLEKLASRRKGLILVTGSAGAGKTTTLAALIGLINKSRACHIVTIEDPIEYRHDNQRAVIEQIEVGRDARSFAGALRSILRQSPDVILLGEIRDNETMSTAITAAETGHLVLATLHTTDAVGAIGRIVDAFGADQQAQVRQQLSLGLAAVIAQQLIPASQGNERFAAVEILVANNAVANLIRRGEDHMLRSQLSLGKSDGMVSMEESLAALVRNRLVDRETATAHSPRPDDFSRYIGR